MSRVRSLLGSFVFASVAACAAAPPPASHPAAPAPAKVEKVAKVEIDRAALRAKLAVRRAEVVERFLAYRDARAYPVARGEDGTYHHVWIDEYNQLCAAATLVSKDWGREVAIQIGQDNVGIRLADADGELLDWILTSGMTQAELVAIQVPGFVANRNVPREREIRRLYDIYVDVERQVRSLWDKNLDLAVDALMKRPDLAREVLAGRIASAGHYARAVASK